MDVENVPSKEDHIQISKVSVCTILLCYGSGINHLLNCSGCFILAYLVPYDLVRLSDYHGHDIDVFPRFSLWLIF